MKKKVLFASIGVVAACAVLGILYVAQASRNQSINLNGETLAGISMGQVADKTTLEDALGACTQETADDKGGARLLLDHPPRFASVAVDAAKRVTEVSVGFSDSSAEQTYKTAKGIGAQSTLDDVLAAYGERCERKFERSFMGSGDITTLRYRDRELRVALEFTFQQIDPYSDSKEQRLMGIRIFKE